MEISRDKVIFGAISLIFAVLIWAYVKEEKVSECQADQNSHEDCLEVIKRLE